MPIVPCYLMVMDSLEGLKEGSTKKALDVECGEKSIGLMDGQSEKSVDIEEIPHILEQLMIIENGDFTLKAVLKEEQDIFVKNGAPRRDL